MEDLEGVMGPVDLLIRATTVAAIGNVIVGEWQFGLLLLLTITPLAIVRFGHYGDL